MRIKNLSSKCMSAARNNGISILVEIYLLCRLDDMITPDICDMLEMSDQ